MLDEFPGASFIATAHLKHLSCLLDEASKGRFKSDKAYTVREAERKFIGSVFNAKSIELRHTIRRIRQIDDEVAEIEAEIKNIMESISSPILSIPGIGYDLGATIIAEVGDFSRFENADKSLPMQVARQQHISPDRYIQHMQKWESVDPNIFARRFFRRQNLSVFGTIHSEITLRKNGQKLAIFSCSDFGSCIAIPPATMVIKSQFLYRI